MMIEAEQLTKRFYNIIGKEKTLVLFDIHAPFHREEEIVNIILKHRNEINTIIFAGDVIDCKSISKYPDEIRQPLIDEVIITYKLLKKIDKLTPGIKKILIWGNHEYRYIKYLAETKSEFNPFHSDNILTEIVNGFTYYDRLRKKKTVFPPLSSNFTVINKWYCQHNDLIVAHPKNFYPTKVKTATETVKHFVEKGFCFRGLLIGHTHKVGWAYAFGKWCGEGGCICLPMEYADNGNIKYTPQEYGYAIVSFVNGKLDVNESRIYRLELEEGEDEWLEETEQ